MNSGKDAMKHHRLISRVPEMAQQQPFEPGTTSLESKLNFVVAMFNRAVEFTFNKTR